MRRGWKILLGAIVVLIALLAVNAVVVNSQTAPAEINADGAELLELTSVDLQVVDQPAAGTISEGAPIVLLHCYACSLHWWEQVLPLVNEGHRVVRIDLVGFGGSQKPKSGYGIDEQAAAVAEALNRLEVRGAVVVGHSMGGTVATALAERASELVDRVAIIGTPSSHEEASLPFVSRVSRAPVLGPALWRVRTDGLIKRGYESAFAPDFDFEAAFADPDQVVLDNRAMTYTSSSEAPEAADDFTDGEDLASRLTGTGVPVLAILGEEDQIVDTPAAAESYGTVPGAEVTVLEGVGHSPNVEVPADTAELLLRFAGAAPPPEPLEPPEPANGESEGPGQAGSAAQGSEGDSQQQAGGGRKGQGGVKRGRNSRGGGNDRRAGGGNAGGGRRAGGGNANRGKKGPGGGKRAGAGGKQPGNSSGGKGRK